MSRVVLLRHGRTEANEKWLYCGQSDVPLSPGGRARLAELRDGGGYPDPSGFAVYTSCLRRTEETLALLFGPVPHTRVPGLNEIHFGAFEMKSYEELQKDPAFLAWRGDPGGEAAPPGGESGGTMRRRVLETFRRLTEDGRDVLIVAHGGPIAAIMGELFPGEVRDRWQWQPEGGEGYEICLNNGRAVSYRPVPEEKPMDKSEKSGPMEWEGKGYSFFQNRACEYFPCHEMKDTENFNCLFCYCPLYALGDRCGGNFRYLKNGFKDCSGCAIPHVRQNFGRIIDKYPLIAELAKNNRQEK